MPRNAKRISREIQKEKGECIYYEKADKISCSIICNRIVRYRCIHTSFAATAHWEQEGEDWVYLDKDGDKVTDTWVSVDNSDDNECPDQEDNSTIWYFFGSNGEAKRGDSGKKVFTNIPYGENMDKKGIFAFDEDGHMLTGWQDITLTNGTYRYYFGEENEGWAHLEWQYLEKPEDDNFEDVNPFEDEAWFWFGTNGRAAQNTTKYINGQYYTFAESGAMNDKWVQGTPGISKSTGKIASDADAFYTASIGHRRTGWMYTFDPDDADEEGDEYWFYLNNKGEAFNDRGKDTKRYDAKGNVLEDVSGTDASKVLDPTSVGENVAAKVIKNKTYLFDENGRMLTGLRYIDGKVLRQGGKALNEDGLAGVYYFSADGDMQTGKQTVDDEGDKYTYYFQKSGKAYTDRLVKGSVYGPNGVRYEAEYGSKYEVITVDNDILDEGGKKVIDAGSDIIVNSSGSVKKSATTVDVDGTKYKVTNYVATIKEDE